MKLYLLIFLLLNVFLLSAQKKTDTLCLFGKKYILERTKITYPYLQRNNILLPSEYNDLDKKDKFFFKSLDPDFRYYEIDADNPGIMIGAYERRDTMGRGNSIIIDNIIDTIYLETNYYPETPFILSGTKKYYLCYSKIVAIKNEQLIESSIRSNTEPIEFDTAIKNDHGEVKPGIYIAYDIYYRKGTSTYYLNRAIVFKKQ